MSDRYRTQSDCRESGLDWLGRIPKSWQLRRLGSYFQERRTKVSDADFPPLSVTMQGIVPQLETAAKTDDGDNRKLVRIGDFVINSRSDRKGSSGVSPYDGSVSLISIVLKPIGFCPPFVHHLLRSEAFQEEFYRFGKGIVADLWSTNYSAMKNIVVPVMTTKEQSQIAKFLDYETAKIDALIEKQQQLIALLKEKRQAVISHAVTKGLNPDAPMRDSGVEWLGEVPAHWEVTRLKYTKSERRNAFVDGPFGSNLKSEHFLDDGTVFVIESGFATSGELQEDNLKRISEQHFATISRSEARAGDIIIAKIGARYGMSSILPPLSSKAVVSGNSLKLSVDSETMSVEYAHALLGVLKVCGAMDDDVNVTAQPALSLGGLNNLLFLRPPLTEQAAIVTELETRRGKLDSLISAALSFAETLSERRTALISAAVTGKIDVRGWKPPESKPLTEAA